MSISVFPIPTLQPGSLMSGSRTWPVTKYPQFSTIIQKSASFRGEFRTSLTPYPIWQFSMDLALLSGQFNLQSSLQSVIGFFMQMRGSWDDWLWPDPDDNTILSSSPAAFAIGDGTTTAFQLTRPISGGTDIVQNLNSTPNIYKNGSLQTNTTYSLSSLGVVTFNTAPAAGAILSWSGSYYFRCRFKADMLTELKQVAPSVWTCSTFEFQSVIL